MKKILVALVFLCVATGLLSAWGSWSPSEEAVRLYRQGELKKAFKLYKKAAKKEKTAKMYLNAAVVAREMGEVSDALDVLEDAAEMFPNNVAIAQLTGSLYLSDGKYEKAIVVLSKTCALPESSPSCYIDLSLAYSRQEKYEPALEALKNALAKDDSLSAAYYLMGTIYDKTGRAGDAVDAYENALRLDGQFLEARAALAAEFARSGKNNDAWKHYKRLSYAEPKDDELKAKTTALEPLLTKSPDKILPPKTISSHSKVKPALGTEGLPMLKIGIGTTSGGAPNPLDKVDFSCSGNFQIDNSSSTKVIAHGKRRETWTISVSTANSRAELYDPAGTLVDTFNSSIFIRHSPGKPGTTIIRAMLVGHGTAWAGISDKEFRGDIEVFFNAKTGQLSLINHVNIEEYVYGVLSSEMPFRFPPEALKAQAVLARTYAMGNIGKHRKNGYDLCDGQHCQVYNGVKAESSQGNAAIDATRGEIFVYNGKPINAVFFSNCGGFTQTGEGAGWKNEPYWQQRSDYIDSELVRPEPYDFQELFTTSPRAYCSPSVYMGGAEYRWSRVLNARYITDQLSLDGKMGAVEAVIPLKRNSAGHVQEVLVEFEHGKRQISKESEIRNLLAIGLLRSTAFVLETVSGKDGKPELFLLYGAGWGHGVGFCQSGASGRAEAGQNYSEILRHYYPGATLKNLKK